MMICRRSLMIATTAVLATFAFVGTAQAWEPNKPFDFIVTADKGSGVDQIARLILGFSESR